VVARELIGKTLMVGGPGGTTAGYVVETEAYLGLDDPASHAYRGPTRRNQVMFEACGHLYVYLSYGVHHCVNTVARPAGIAAGAVLLRAVHPVSGLRLMARRRGLSEDVPDDLAFDTPVPARWRVLTNGPGKLTQAMGIGPNHNGLELAVGEVSILEGLQVAAKSIEVSMRIGISQAVEEPYRFSLAGDPFVSRR
jgi:DNA-3-methyladenine glycosylase